MDETQEDNTIAALADQKASATRYQEMRDAMRQGLHLAAAVLQDEARMYAAGARAALWRLLPVTWRDEFPTFTEAEIPALPAEAGFTDTSWHNNTCPSFTSDKIGLHLWVETADPAQREYPDWTRYVLDTQSAGIETGTILETDSLPHVLAAVGLYMMNAAQLNDWYAVQVGYRPQVDDPRMTDDELRDACMSYLRELNRQGETP